MKKTIWSLLPQFLKTFILIFYQRKKLDQIQAIDLEGKEEKLLSPSEFNRENIFQNSKIQAVWEEWKAKIDSFHLPDGTGGVNPGDRRALFYLVSYFRPQKVLEIGTHIGASTVHIAAGMQSFQTGESRGHLDTVDITDVNDSQTQPWKDYGASHGPKEMIQKLGSSEVVSFHTRAALDYLADSKRTYDFIFLDGDHSSSAVYREIPQALQILNPGGIILLHDYFPQLEPYWKDELIIPGPYLAVHRLRQEGCSLKALPLARLPWPTKKGGHLTTLALLTRDQ